MRLWSSLPADRLFLEFSLWSANLTRLADDVRRTEPHADVYHIDVADAHFVPGLLFFPDLVAALRPLTRVPFHVHLMADRPARLIDDFAQAGANAMTVHLELGDAVPALLRQIRGHGLSVGLAVQVETPIESVAPYLDTVDALVLMGTRLGIKGIDLAPQAPARLRAARDLLTKTGYADRIRLIADGGIRSHTVPTLYAAGADGIVPGSLVFKSADLTETVDWLHHLNRKGDA